MKFEAYTNQPIKLYQHQYFKWIFEILKSWWGNTARYVHIYLLYIKYRENIIKIT